MQHVLTPAQSNTSAERQSSKERLPGVLVLDDDELLRRAFTGSLERMGLEVYPASTTAEAWRILDSAQIGLALVDFNLGPGQKDGAEFIRDLMSRHTLVTAIGMTGYGDAAVAERMLRAGARAYVTRPIEDWGRLTQLIQQSLHSRGTPAESSEDQREFEARMRELPPTSAFHRLIGNSPAMSELRRMVLDFGPRASRINVLITGESGTGKELAARALHDVGRTRGEPFIPINCATIAENLLEAELFGAEPGSFTGSARNAMIGVFEKVGQGTLFLDEVGELSLDHQSKLLRAIHERTFNRIGSRHKTLNFNGRVICATHRDLKQMVNEKRFRQDLYWRMNVLHIEVPPLRERREDVPLLAYHFLKRYIEIDGTANIRHIHPAAMAMLERHEFTENNIRELENIILRAAGRCRGDTLRLPDIERAMELEPAARRPGTNAPPTAVQDWDPLMDLPLTEAKGQVRDWFTWEYIRRRLVECNGNITLASEKSGMLRPNFIREMRRVRITVEVALEARRRGRPELRAATEPEEDAD